MGQATATIMENKKKNKKKPGLFTRADCGGVRDGSGVVVAADVCAKMKEW